MTDESITPKPAVWNENPAEGDPLPVVCTGGKEPHAKRVLARFQKYDHKHTKPQRPWVWIEIYGSGLTPPFDQYLLQDSNGSWTEVSEQDAQAAMLTGIPYRAKWSRQCPKCGRHYVFDSESLQAKISDAGTRGNSWLDLSN
jgi:hypothetical protein